MNRTARLICSIVINLIVTAASTGVVISYFMGNITNVTYPYETLFFFTTDSNLIAALGCLLVAEFEIGILRGKRNSIPQWAALIKYAGMISLLLTFLTVMTLLLPLYGTETVTGTSFHMHIMAPALTFFSFVFLESGRKLDFSRSLWGMAPMLIYGLIYLIMVVFIGFNNGGWTDFYSFNRNGLWYISLAMMTSATFALCMSTRFLYNLVAKIRKVNYIKKKALSH